MTTATKEYAQLAARVYATTFANKPGRNRRQTPICPAVLAAAGSHRNRNRAGVCVAPSHPPRIGKPMDAKVRSLPASFAAGLRSQWHSVNVRQFATPIISAKRAAR